MAAPGARSDHYAVLGVEPTASAREITSAYRALVRVLHPDCRPGHPQSAGRLGEVIAAHAVLRDPDRRAAYDTRDDQGTGNPTADPPAAPAGHPSGRSVPVRVHRAESHLGAAEPLGRPWDHGRPRPAGPDLLVGPTRTAPGPVQPGDLADWVLQRLWNVGHWL